MLDRTGAPYAAAARDRRFAGPLIWAAAVLAVVYLLSLAVLVTAAIVLDRNAPPHGVGSESVFVGDRSAYLLDHGSIVDADDLLSDKTAERFLSPTGAIPVFPMQYFDNGWLWLRFTVPAIGGEDGQSTIRLSDPRVRQARLVVRTGDAVAERDWAFDDALRRSGLGSRTPAFHFDRAELTGAEAWLGFTSLSVLRGSVFVESRRAYEAWSMRQVVLPAVFGGALVALALYLSIIGVLLREWPLIAGGAMSFFIMTVIFGGPGLVHVYLLPGHPALADMLAYLPKPLAVSAWLVFLVLYLDLWRRSPTAAGLLSLIAVAIPFQTVFAGLKIGLGWDMPIQVTSSGPVLVALVAGLGILGFYAFHRDRRAQIFLLCWLPLVFGMFVRSYIILFPSPVTARMLAEDPFIDVVLSMTALAIALVIDVQARELGLRRDAEAKEQRLRHYAEIASDSFFETRSDGVVASAAGPLARELGLVAGSKLTAILDGRVEDGRRLAGQLDHAMRTGRSLRGVEVAVVRLDGRPRWLAFSASPWRDADGDGDPGGLRGTIIDVTEQMAQRAKEAEQDKLIAMGRLAGGIAHEVNNLLHPIVNLARRVRDRHVSDPAGRQMLDLVIDSGKRAGEVVGGVLDAVSPARRRGPPLPVSVAVERATAAVLASLPPGIRIDQSIEPLTRPEVSVGEMLQVIGNLVQNAARAIGPGGRISIALSGHGDAGAILTVADDGAGMTEAVRRAATEPFVTTRADGTGLGLSAVSSIVTLWGAAIDIRSSPGEGTTVAIMIPAMHREPVEIDANVTKA